VFKVDCGVQDLKFYQGGGGYGWPKVFGGKGWGILGQFGQGLVGI